ncbi:M1 family metallopeptidase [Mucilaginibacter sp. KACC 22063]|uniref:M1 family metallopeptidase n=1 Tax=Mucilaginibacter sp. KACC 22063 TaxID=3025666 RepID=UPI00236645DC|nr:M1 family metallopeptidase [Mucilaginibacter sp. KACC 22063]WDF54954.1 M1 family metallopeptidase [Mucilaginibacter sp. KACC 22063]
MKSEKIINLMFIKKTLPALLIAGVFISAHNGAFAQEPVHKDPMSIYRATATKINDLVNTKLDVKFDYKKRYLYGKEWVTLKPHFYPTDSLRLDAKGMDIHQIAVVKNGKNVPLKYSYDNMSLNIKLDKKYLNSEKYTIYIDYTSKPDELKVQGSAAINDAKGLYFINTDSTEKGKPVQIWTQGESESNSAWFPTIDKPNQKTTDEISMTVPGKYVTLSNGRLASQKKNADGTRTDTWVMDLPHAPYLIMMAVGDFRIYHDKWRNKEVNYYLEPKYAPYAKDIFGFTPEVMEYFSNILGVDYPWNKYSQIVVRDYVSGAMENTTATLHGEQVQLTRRQLIDGGSESLIDIVHELFHQWFGDYVTTESWSNLTVNESFADLSETLWMEHKYGADAGNEYNYKTIEPYFQTPGAATRNLVRFYYNDKEDVFDMVTYRKGGRILNMLRHYLGDDAFFKGLNLYLKTNAFKAAEAQQLRLAFEEVSGQDLNWFFNQWYYGAGHPVLSINYQWDEATKTQSVILNQSQDGNAFILPLKVDIYTANGKERKQVWMRDKSDTLTFKLAAKPKLVNVDADKVLLCIKVDNHTPEEFAYQYFNGPLYLDRHEALAALSPHQDTKGAREVVLAALNDRYWSLQVEAINALNMKNDDVRNAALPILTKLAQTSKRTEVQAAALHKLADLKAAGNLNIFKNAIGSESYMVEAAALRGIAQIDAAEALTYAHKLEKDSDGPLKLEIANIYATNGQSADWPFVYEQFTKGRLDTKARMMRNFANMAAKVDNPAYAQQGISELVKAGKRFKEYGQTPRIIEYINTVKAGREKLGDQASAKAAEDGIKELQ